MPPGISMLEMYLRVADQHSLIHVKSSWRGELKKSSSLIEERLEDDDFVSRLNEGHKGA